MNFFDLPIIQIALSIIVSWALFAIFLGLIQEAVAQVLAERGRFMKTYLLKQLWDEANNINWASLIYMHGSVDLLSRAYNKPTNDIEPKLFAKTFIEVLGSSHAAQMNLIPQVYQNKVLNDFKSAVTTLERSDVVTFLRMAMNNAELNDSSAKPSNNESVVYDNLVKQIVDWYNEFQERLSLWYKKRMRQRLFIFGLIAALILNVDSIQLFNFYRIHPESREAVQRYYQNYVADSAQSLLKAPPKQVAQSLDSLAKAVELPVGYDYSVFKQHPATKCWFFWKLLGIVISGFAVSFGAPFWFDVLKKAYSTKPKIPSNAVL
ncbi:hypothetical protein [Pinibacter aurantiacus]|uniref:Uncharacterized protein n=1 Tax=Pinibacter aurantiacus TaxID=2851599 RepID=A0A9E2SCK5_9BACT|nr:hypothetical protein [Pinibacter aurantiacus]MBV4360501.1 hypothetical protein [Pinibacter aurantiacus]